MPRPAPLSRPSLTATANSARRALLVPLLLIATTAGALADTTPAGRWLRVDPRDPDAYPTLATAANDVRPGDTLWLAPGSGPYREELFIRQSGTEAAPITIEANGNEITGFDPIHFTSTAPGAPLTARVDVPPPFVLRHHGARLPEDPVTRLFLAPAAASAIDYDPATGTLTLGPEATPDGWEISTRQNAVRIENTSWQHYRNIVATGALNDGFNLHGRGEGLLFTNITACHNLDEGFSSHDHINSEIHGGRFFGNDNGLVNILQSQTRLIDVQIWDNLGIGLELHDNAAITAQGLVIWGNGLRQFALINTPEVSGTGIIIHANAHPRRPWLTYKESAKQTQPPVTLVGDQARTLAAAGTIKVVTTPTPFTSATP